MNRRTAEPVDDLLARWLPTERSRGFDRLARVEQAWRGRVFLMCWAWTRSAAYAWALAGSNEPAQMTAWRALVERTADGRIDEALRLTVHERVEASFFRLGSAAGDT